MNICRGISLAVLTASLSFYGLANAEDQPFGADAPAASAVDTTPPSGPDTSAPDQASNGQAPSSTAPAPDDQWHINATFYLWLPGVHGNLNAFGYNLGFKASPGDLLSHADFGLMGLVGAQYKRFVLVSDILWTPLTITKTKIFGRLPSEPSLTAKVKYTQTKWTEEAGYRMVNNERIKIDGLAGFRYWYQGTTLTLTPPQPLQTNNHVSKSWIDPLIGARIVVPLSPKIEAMIWGDAGGWGTGSQLDWNLVSALSYKFKPKWDMDVAWRYLYVDYAKKNTSSQTAMSGIVLGVTYAIK